MHSYIYKTKRLTIEGSSRQRRISTLRPSILSCPSVGIPKHLRRSARTKFKKIIVCLSRESGKSTTKMVYCRVWNYKPNVKLGAWEPKVSFTLTNRVKRRSQRKTKKSLRGWLMLSHQSEANRTGNCTLKTSKTFRKSWENILSKKTMTQKYICEIR